jgi:uncharacterized membrane protein
MALRMAEREELLIRRSWTKAERRVVINGLLGRLLIAAEPAICFLIFAGLTVGLVFFPLPPDAKLTRWESAIVIAPIFGVVSVAFLIYAIAVLVAPVRALMRTFSPIFIVDGYLRLRSRDERSQADTNGYIAVLDYDRALVFEWPSLGDVPLRDSARPALVEFSRYGGVHRIDGKVTGVLPESIAPCGVGISRS